MRHKDVAATVKHMSITFPRSTATNRQNPAFSENTVPVKSEIAPTPIFPKPGSALESFLPSRIDGEWQLDPNRIEDRLFMKIREARSAVKDKKAGQGGLRDRITTSCTNFFNPKPPKPMTPPWDDRPFTNAVEAMDRRAELWGSSSTMGTGPQVVHGADSQKLHRGPRSTA